MESAVPYLAVLLGAFFAYKITQAYIRRFGAVWWQGYIIGFPAGFIGTMPVHAFDQTPEWLSRFTVFFMIAVVMAAYDGVKKEKQPKQAAENNSHA